MTDERDIVERLEEHEIGLSAADLNGHDFHVDRTIFADAVFAIKLLRYEVSLYEKNIEGLR